MQMSAALGRETRVAKLRLRGIGAALRASLKCIANA